VQALAGRLDFNIAMLSLSQRGLNDDLLNHLLLNIPPRTIVLLEDADAAFSNRRQKDTDGYTGANVTYSGLLNALDGVASAEERMIFMTTNHIDRLDDALIRPGRIDMTVNLGNATEWQMERLWDRFYAQYDPSGKFSLTVTFCPLPPCLSHSLASATSKTMRKSFTLSENAPLEPMR
jgi:chaperone BCS1